MELVIIFLIFIAAANAANKLKSEFAEEYDQLSTVGDRIRAVYKKFPKKVQEDAILTTPELIRKYGYPCEIHLVITEDGYILQMHRIPHGKTNFTGPRLPVYVQHGFASSSADWVLIGPDKALAYLLADHGYDVWLGNTRDNLYGRRHINLDVQTDAKEFWDFTLTDIGMYDIAAMTDYVISQTNVKSIPYIGHSQGTTDFYILLSERPEYADKFKVAIHYAPISFQRSTRCPYIRVFSKIYKEFELLADLLKIYQFPPSNLLTAELGQIICGDQSPLQKVCTEVYFTIFGFAQAVTNASTIPLIFGHDPAGFTFKTVYQFSQLIKSGKFRQYDYKIVGNLKRYGQPFPPDYNLGNVKCPVELFYTNNDFLSGEDDVQTLSGLLPASKKNYVEDYDHLAYQFAVNVVEKVYVPTLDILENYV